MSNQDSTDQRKTVTDGIARALAAAVDRKDGSLGLVAAISVVQLRKL